MSDEQPVPIKKRKVDSRVDPDGNIVCVIHFSQFSGSDKVKPVSDVNIKTINRVKLLRQGQSNDIHRMDMVCSQIPDEFDPSVHGIHRWCYTKFISTGRIPAVETTTEQADARVKSNGTVPKARAPYYTFTTTRSCSQLKSTDKLKKSLFPQTTCIFCKKGPSKEAKKSSGQKGRLVKCLTSNAEMSIRDAAVRKNDFDMLRLITDESLIAKEARYHESCRAKYVKKPKVFSDLHTNAERANNTQARQLAYDEAFKYICTYVSESIISRCHVERLTMIRDRFMDYLESNYPVHYNPDYQTHLLKEKLSHQFGSAIRFYNPGFKGLLVFSSALDIGEAVAAAFQASTSESQILSDAAAIIRNRIKLAQFRSSDTNTAWPPSASFLSTQRHDELPREVVDFFCMVIRGKPLASASIRTCRLSHSVAEDLCSATTSGCWKMAKQLFLGYTMRRLTGREDVVTILNRFGHSVSYSSLMELETSVARQVITQDSIIPANISVHHNKVCHLVWDNFDINEQTPTGLGTTHNTHGIIVQEVQNVVEDEKSDCKIVDKIERSRARSLKITPPIIEHSQCKKKNEPVLFNLDCEGTASHLDTLADDRDQKMSENLWLIARSLLNGKSSVPDWSGWVSVTAGDCLKPVRESVIGYMRPVMASITRYDTVQHCLVTSIEVTKKLAQPFTFVTMDLAAAKIAYDIIWGSGDRFRDVIVHLGPFHTVCSYLGALGKLVTGSGFEEIIIDSGICASGSISQILSGKHYNRAVRCHHLMLLTLERLLLEKFSSLTNVDMCSSQVMQELAQDPSNGTLSSAIGDKHCQEVTIKYGHFKEQVRQGKHGKTAQFWLTYIDCVWLMLRFQRAWKENNVSSFIFCLREMCNLLFSADHTNYARYLPLYYVQLCNLVKSHPDADTLLREGGLTAARSLVPACRIPMDMTIEQTINRSAKTSGGIIGFSRSPSAYTRWCLTRHVGASYVEALLEAADVQDNNTDSHKTLRPSAKKRSEADVCQLKGAIEQFINPFNIEPLDHDHLYCLSSGKAADTNVEESLLSYVTVGARAVNEFINNRILKKEIKFHAPISKLKVPTFASMAAKTTITTSKKKVIEMKAERNIFGQLLLMSQQHNICLDRLFCYPLGPVPWSLATADGNMTKTNKAELMHVIESLIKSTDSPSLGNHSYVIDGNALIQSLTDVPETFEDLAKYVFACLPKVATVHFVTDLYWHASIKTSERNRRGNGELFRIEGSRTRVPRDFKGFLSNAKNKVRLFEILLSEWCKPAFASLLFGRKVYFVCGYDSVKMTLHQPEDCNAYVDPNNNSCASCVCLHSEDSGIVTASMETSLFSSHEEADTRLVLHVLFEASSAEGDEKIIVVRSPDTDVFLLLVHYVRLTRCTIIFETGVGNNRRLINVTELHAAVGSDIAMALPALHAFTGCDTVSAFVRKGKRMPFKLVQKNPKFIQMFQQMGDTLPLCDDLFQQLEEFVCTMYGQTAESNVNDARFNMFRNRFGTTSCNTKLNFNSGTDISLLPPCQSTLRLHSERANYQAYIWKHSHVNIVDLPSPTLHGWITTEEGCICINWTNGTTLPEDLIAILDSSSAVACVNPTSGQTDANQCDNAVYEIQCDVEEDDVIDNTVDIIFENDEDD